jgi:hypothetical protein
VWWTSDIKSVYKKVLIFSHHSNLQFYTNATICVLLKQNDASDSENLRFISFPEKVKAFLRFWNGSCISNVLHLASFIFSTLSYDCIWLLRERFTALEWKREHEELFEELIFTVTHWTRVAVEVSSVRGNEFPTLLYVASQVENISSTISVTIWKVSCIAVIFPNGK